MSERVRVRACGRFVLAARLDPANERYQVVARDGRRYRALTVDGDSCVETRVTLARRGHGARVWRTSLMPEGVRTEWLRTNGVALSGTATMAYDGSWESERRNSDGTRTHTVSDGKVTVETTTDETTGEVVGSTVATRNGKDHVGKDTLDGQGHVTSHSQFDREQTDSPDSITTKTSEEDTTFDENGDVTGSRTTTTTRTYDKQTGTTTIVTDTDQSGTFSTGGGSERVHSESKQSRGVTTTHTITDFGAGGTSDETRIEGPGHSEQRSVGKDGQGQIVSESEMSTDRWRDAGGDHTDTRIHNSSGGTTTDRGVHETKHDDGSSDSTTETTTTDADGTRTERSGAHTDRKGNESVTTSHENDDGTWTITTTTTDRSGNGSEHTTVVDKEGNTVSESTTNVGSGPSSGNGDDGDDSDDGDDGDDGDDSDDGDDGNGDSEMPSDEGTDEGPRRPVTHEIGKALGYGPSVSLDADYGHEDAGGRFEKAREALRDVVIGAAEAGSGSGWGDTSGSEEAPGRIDMEIDASASASDDWGDLNNPRALVATIESVSATANRALGQLRAERAVELEAELLSAQGL